MANMFLLLTNIDGESLDAAYAGTIEVEDWEWGLHNHAAFKLTGSQAAQHTRFKHLTVHKKLDKSSPTLMLYCTHGTKIREAVLICRKNAGEFKVDYLTITLQEVKVHSVDWPVKGGSDVGGFAETLELSFHKVQVEYQLQKADGTSAGATVFQLYDIGNPDAKDE
jgi:type VI secretion system secreted protein Hcp